MAAVGMVGSAITRAANDGVPDQPVDPNNIPERRLQIAVANTNLGIAYLRQGDFDKSLQKLEKARLAEPAYAPVYSALGLLYQSTKQADKADENFNYALRLAPDNPSFQNTYASFLCKRDFEKAETLFMQAANNPLYSSQANAWSNAGTCALKQGDREKAESYFLEALNRNPDLAPTLIQMAELSLDRHEYAIAGDYLNRYLANASHTPKSLWIGIQVEKVLGDRDKASSYAMLLRNRYPDTEEAKLLMETQTDLR